MVTAFRRGMSLLLSVQLFFSPFWEFEAQGQAKPVATKADVLSAYDSARSELALELARLNAPGAPIPSFGFAAQTAQISIEAAKSRNDFSRAEIDSMLAFRDRLLIAEQATGFLRDADRCEARAARTIMEGLGTADPFQVCAAERPKENEPFNEKALSSTQEVLARVDPALRASKSESPGKIEFLGTSPKTEKELAIAQLETLRAQLVTQYVQNAMFYEANASDLDSLLRGLGIADVDEVFSGRNALRKFAEEQVARAPKSVRERDERMESRRDEINRSLQDVIALNKKNAQIANVFVEYERLFPRLLGSPDVVASGGWFEERQPDYLAVTDPMRDLFGPVSGQRELRAPDGYRGIAYNPSGGLSPEATLHGAVFPDFVPTPERVSVQRKELQIKVRGDESSQLLRARVEYWLQLQGKPLQGAPDWLNYDPQKRRAELKKSGLQGVVDLRQAGALPPDRVEDLINEQIQREERVLGELRSAVRESGGGERALEALERSIVEGSDSLWVPGDRERGRRVRLEAMRELRTRLPEGAVTADRFSREFFQVASANPDFKRMVVEQSVNQQRKAEIVGLLANDVQFYSDPENIRILGDAAKGNLIGARPDARGVLVQDAIARERFVAVAKLYLDQAKSLIREVNEKLRRLKSSGDAQVPQGETDDAIQMAMYNPMVVAATLEVRPELLGVLCAVTARMSKDRTKADSMDRWVGRIGGILSLGALVAAGFVTGGAAWMAAPLLLGASGIGFATQTYSATRNWAGYAEESAAARRNQMILDAMGGASGLNRQEDVLAREEAASQRKSAAVTDSAFAAVSVLTAGTSALAPVSQLARGTGTALGVGSTLTGLGLGAKGAIEAWNALDSLSIQRERLITRLPLSQRDDPAYWPDEVKRIDDQIADLRLNLAFDGALAIGGGLAGYKAGAKVKANARETVILNKLRGMAQDAGPEGLQVEVLASADGKIVRFKGKNERVVEEISLSELSALNPKLARTVEAIARRAVAKRSGLTQDGLDQVYFAVKAKYGEAASREFLDWVEKNGLEGLKQAGVTGPCLLSVSGPAR